tara:strand:+ start:569 stop:820 length:252 start_codon:yes stop_codon:yes gene_type:complete
MENKMTNVSINLGDGYRLSIAQGWLDKNKVEVALLHDDTFVNTRYWYYTNIKFDDDYDDVVRYLDADKLLTALVKAKAYAKGE